MQIDLLPNLPPSGGYENLLKAIDVFSRYLFAYPLTDASSIVVVEIPILATKTPKLKVLKTIDSKYFLENISLKSGVFQYWPTKPQKLKVLKTIDFKDFLEDKSSKIVFLP